MVLALERCSEWFGESECSFGCMAVHRAAAEQPPIKKVLIGMRFNFSPCGDCFFLQDC